MGAMIAVVETDEFLADVKDVLSEDEHDALILYVAHHPEAGDLMPETGGSKNIQTDLTPRQRKALARQLSAMKMEWKEKRGK